MIQWVCIHRLGTTFEMFSSFCRCHLNYKPDLTNLQCTDQKCTWSVSVTTTRHTHHNYQITACRVVMPSYIQQRHTREDNKHYMHASSSYLTAHIHYSNPGCSVAISAEKPRFSATVIAHVSLLAIAMSYKRNVSLGCKTYA